MTANQSPGAAAARRDLVSTALRLVSVSVAFGLISGSVSVVTGLGDHSLGVFAIGLGVLADVAGSAVLIWRFRAELSHPVRSGAAEARAGAVVSASLAVVAVVILAQSAATLGSGQRPGTSAAALIAAGVSVAVLTPLSVSKRRLGKRMGSRALTGDGALSGIGAATSLLALAGLVLYRVLGWWWADGGTALLVAAIAATEAWHMRRDSGPELAGRPGAAAGRGDLARTGGRPWRHRPGRPSMLAVLLAIR